MKVADPLRLQQRTQCMLLVGRLYLLARDAYLSPPAQMRRKLLDLRDLQAATHTELTSASLPSDLGTVHGVRLIESLRACLHRCTLTTTRHERELALLDIVTSCAPHGFAWGPPASTLAVEIAGLLLPEMAPAKVGKLPRRHRELTQTVAAPLRHLPAERIDGTLDAVAGMMAGVYGLQRPTALSAALVTLSAQDGDGARTSMPAPAGGVLFHRLDGARPGQHRYVGSALAELSPSAFAHHLATLELVVQHRSDLAGPVADRLSDVRADLEATRARDDATADACLRSLDGVLKRVRGPRANPLRLLAAGVLKRGSGGLSPA